MDFSKLVDSVNKIDLNIKNEIDNELIAKKYY